MSAQSGIETEPCSEGGMNVTALEHGDWIKISGVDFGAAGAAKFQARVAAAAPSSGAGIELRLDHAATGTLIGTCAISATGGAQIWSTQSGFVTGATGTHDLYLRFTGSGGGGASLLNLDWWRFER